MDYCGGRSSSPSANQDRDFFLLNFTILEQLSNVHVQM